MPPGVLAGEMIQTENGISGREKHFEDKPSSLGMEETQGASESLSGMFREGLTVRHEHRPEGGKFSVPGDAW